MNHERIQLIRAPQMYSIKIEPTDTDLSIGFDHRKNEVVISVSPDTARGLARELERRADLVDEKMRDGG